MPLIRRPFDPWGDDDQWLPPIGGDDESLMASAYPPPPLYGPPATPAPPPTPAPMIAPATPTALDRLAELERRRPLRTDPNLKPSTKRSVLGGIAGALAGGAAGYVNASGRVRVPNVGADIADRITNAPYNRAAREFEEQRAGLEPQVQIEAVREGERRKTAESAARIKSETAQEEAAKAARARAERIESPRPITASPEQDVINPVTGEVIRKGTPRAAAPPSTIEARINRIRLDPNLTDDQKETQVRTAITDYNAIHPEKPVTHWTTDDSGNVRLISGAGTEASKTGGVKSFGKVGKSKSEPVNQAGTNAAAKTAAENEAMNLLQANAGDHDKAIAAAKSMAVRKELQQDKRRKKLASDETSDYDKIIDKLDKKSPGGGKPSTGTPSTGKPEYKVGDIVEKDGKRYRIKAIRDGKLDVDPI